MVSRMRRLQVFALATVALAACGTPARTTARILLSPEGANLNVFEVTDPNIGGVGSVLGVFRDGTLTGIYRIDHREGHTVMGSMVGGTIEGTGRLELGTVTPAEVEAFLR